MSGTGRHRDGPTASRNANDAGSRAAPPRPLNEGSEPITQLDLDDTSEQPCYPRAADAQVEDIRADGTHMGIPLAVAAIVSLTGFAIYATIPKLRLRLRNHRRRSTSV